MSLIGNSLNIIFISLFAYLSYNFTYIEKHEKIILKVIDEDCIIASMTTDLKLQEKDYLKLKSQVVKKYPDETERHQPKALIFYDSARTIKEQLPKIAEQFLGVPYVYAAKGPHAFDCSGYTAYIFKLCGITITSSSKHQALLGITVPLNKTTAGDLVFFNGYGPPHIVTHVALVHSVSDTAITIIHSNGQRVMMENLLTSKYWRPKVLFTKRILTHEPTTISSDDYVANESSTAENTASATRTK